jgi:hypothetical protein
MHQFGQVWFTDQNMDHTNVQIRLLWVPHSELHMGGFVMKKEASYLYLSCTRMESEMEMPCNVS